MPGTGTAALGTGAFRQNGIFEMNSRKAAYLLALAVALVTLVALVVRATRDLEKSPY